MYTRSARATHAHGGVVGKVQVYGRSRLQGDLGQVARPSVSSSDEILKRVRLRDGERDKRLRRQRTICSGIETARGGRGLGPSKYTSGDKLGTFLPLYHILDLQHCYLQYSSMLLYSAVIRSVDYSCAHGSRSS